MSPYETEIKITQLSKFKLGSSESLIMNASGSEREILELAREISNDINSEDMKCWEDDFITIIMRSIGKFKTNRSRVNHWYNLQKQELR